MSDTILALDAGGTSVKAAIMRDGKALEEAQFSFTGDGQEELLATFREALCFGGAYELSAIGMACPGPFDYANGISLMTHKWRSVKGMPLTSLAKETHPGAEVYFLHDVTAFILGESFDGSAKDARSPAGVTLGTGLGFTYMHNRRVVLDQARSPLVKLWCKPWKDGIAEDYVSRRALRADYARLANCSDPPDAKEIAELARQGDAAAIAAYRRMGEALGDILNAYLPQECDRVVLGGQIARSADCILPYAHCRVTIKAAAHIDDAALRGVWLYCVRTAEELEVYEP